MAQSGKMKEGETLRDYLARRKMKHLLEYLGETVRVELFGGETVEGEVFSFTPGLEIDEDYDIIAIEGRLEAISQDEIKSIEVVA
jgi:hypothetical protein